MEKDFSAAPPTHIPTPEVVPEPPSLANIPKEILQSGVVETLLSQNDDLMARLRVQIRRNHIYESEISKLKNNAHRLERLYNSSGDQIKIWREKEAKWKEKLAEVEGENQRLGSEYNWLEVRFAEMSSTQEETERALQHARSQTQRERRRFESLRQRISRFVRPLIDRIRREKAQQIEATTLLQSQHNELQRRLTDAQESSSRLESEITELQQTHRLQVVSLTESNEQEMLEVRNELDHYKKLTNKLRSRMRDFDGLVEKVAVLENKLIHSRRKRQSLEELQLIESEKTKTDSVRLKKALSESDEVLTEQKREIEQLNIRLRELDKRAADAESQLHALRRSWNEKLEENRRQSQQIESLERVNLEFSQKLSCQNEIDFVESPR